MSEIVMPKFGLTMTEGLITAWHRKPGVAFFKGDILFEVETEKVTNEVEASADGVLAEILCAEGAVVPVGDPIARLVGGGEAVSPGVPVSTPSQEAPRGTDAPSARKLMAEHGLARGDLDASGRDGRVMKEDVLRVIATPLARRIARNEGIDLANVTGTGPRGRIKSADVSGALTAVPAPLSETPLSELPRLVPPDAARAATARRVQAAKRDIPHFYLTRHVETGALNRLRADLNGGGPTGGNTGRPRLSMTHLLVKAIGLAIAAHPDLNRIWLPDGILTLDTVGVGIVTETPHGLRIPIADRADSSPLDELAEACSGLFARARSGKLTNADVAGGAISLSNVGMFGADTLTPIISPPQAMILGVGAEQHLFRPDDNGQPVLRHEIVLTLAADHRLIDGADAARFLATLAQLLEAPFELLRPPVAHSGQ